MMVGSTCPYCRSLMESGFLAGNNVSWWTKKSPRLLIRTGGGNIRLARSFANWEYLKAKKM